MKFNSHPLKQSEPMFLTFDELPEDMQKELKWLYEADAMTFLYPKIVVDARNAMRNPLQLKFIAPGLFIRSDGKFVVRTEDGRERVELGTLSTGGHRGFTVGTFINWAHNKVFTKFIGPVPMGYKIMFLDGDTGNCALENLALAPEEEAPKKMRYHWQR